MFLSLSLSICLFKIYNFFVTHATILILHWQFWKQYTLQGLKDSLYHEEMPAQFLVTNVKYHECRWNHACRDGGYILDGCREFVASGAEGTDSAMTCATCGCHRNFHRKEEQTQMVCACSSHPTTRSGGLWRLLIMCSMYLPNNSSSYLHPSYVICFLSICFDMLV